jgi:hypothetical protein
MKWTVLTALLLLTGGAWLLIYNALDTATNLSASMSGRAQAESTPWLPDRRTVRVEGGGAVIAVRCGDAAPCRGSAELTSAGSGRHLGAAAYDIPAGGDARLRFALPDVARGTTYARLTLRESGGATSSAEITLRRR